ncbi:MAG: hypothetical protein U0234_00680 [Sandaracinus sp.]
MDAVSSLETALGAELLRADLLGAARPRIAERYVVQAFLGRRATSLVVAAYDASESACCSAPTLRTCAACTSSSDALIAARRRTD